MRTAEVTPDDGWPADLQKNKRKFTISNVAAILCQEKSDGVKCLDQASEKHKQTFAKWTLLQYPIKAGGNSPVAVESIVLDTSDTFWFNFWNSHFTQNRKSGKLP